MPRIHRDPRDLTPRERETLRRAWHVLSLMREGTSMTRSCVRVGIDPRTVHRYVGSQLTQDHAGGRYRATSYDRMVRAIQVLTTGGRIVLPIKDSRSASLVSRHWQAVDRGLLAGEWEPMKEFRTEAVTVDGVVYRFMTDPNEIERQGRIGEVSFEDLYGDLK